jgi:L-rhamnose mutarotase
MEPWNEWHGLTEGDMAIELAELDPSRDWHQLPLEDIRQNWWEYIGRFSCDTPEDDGQPDEAQEWHDFDPDC